MVLNNNNTISYDDIKTMPMAGRDMDRMSSTTERIDENHWAYDEVQEPGNQLRQNH